VLLSDPEVSAVSVRDCGEPLTELGESFGPSRALVRASVVRRLVLARDELPRGVALRVVAGYRTAAAQRAIISSYAAGLRMAHPVIGAAELERLTSRFVAPLAVAPHVAGAAVDLTLVDSAGGELDLGTPVDTTPEQSENACYFDARALGMTATRYTDPSGLAASTVSSAADQVVLGTSAMHQPTLAAIAATRSAVIPVAGLVRNLNTLLGQDGITGLKTGSDSAAGGCVLLASWRDVRGGGSRVLIVAAVLGQPGAGDTILPNALGAGRHLMLGLGQALRPA